MNAELNPFDHEPMPAAEIEASIDALIRTYGANAVRFLVSMMEQADTEIGKANWISIAEGYAVRFENDAADRLQAAAGGQPNSGDDTH